MQGCSPKNEQCRAWHAMAPHIHPLIRVMKGSCKQEQGTASVVRVGPRSYRWGLVSASCPLSSSGLTGLLNDSRSIDGQCDGCLICSSLHAGVQR